MSKDPVIIAGAGAAGLLASIAAARQGVPVLLLEKGGRPARKILVSGSGRCNISNQAALEHFIGQYHGNGRFLYPAFNCFFRPELLQLLTEAGIRTKTEPSGKIFPVSDRAADIAQALITLARQAGVQMLLTEPAVRLETRNGLITGVRTTTRTIAGSALILTTGGLSWPQTGSTGDGYRFARELGHQIQPLRPALTGLNLTGTKTKILQGITCPETTIELLSNGKPAGQAAGELLWTHFGLSGPAVLRVSRYLIQAETAWEEPVHWSVRIDFCPSFSQAQMIQLLEHTAFQNARKQVSNLFAAESGLPRSLVDFLLERSQIDLKINAANLSRLQIVQLAANIKSLALNVSSSRGYREAMVTAGGVSLSEVDPRHMKSKIVSNLYFAGEILDLDGDTGGYNLQAAFSTGWLAGSCAALNY